MFRCCVMKRNHETCADCDEFPCEKFVKWLDMDSFVTHQKCFPNIQRIKKIGINAFLREQEERKVLLEIMLEQYNPGKCMSLYCLASSLMGVKSLNEAMEQIESIEENKARSFKILIQDLSERDKIILRLLK
jgi:hypothetical protein